MKSARGTTSLAAPVAEGLHVYLGAPGAGKTTRMLADVIELHERTRSGGIVVYCGEDPREHATSAVSRSLLQLVPRPTLRAALFSAYSASELVLYRPVDARCVLALIAAARRPGRTLLAVDDVGVWTHSAKVRQELGDLAATWRHARTSLFLSLQHVGTDLSQRIRSCAPLVRIFRVPPSTTREWASEEHGLDPAALGRLPVGECVLRQY